MSIVLLLAYFVGLYIAPQEWVPLVKGWPVDWIIYSLLVLAVPFQTEHLSRVVKSLTLWLLVAWIAVIGLSNMLQLQTWWAHTAFMKYGPFLVVFASLLLFVSSTTRLRIVVWFVLFLTAVLAVQCIDQIRTGVGWAGQPLGWDDGYGGRAKWVGTWDGPNVLCLLFVIAVPFLFEFFFKPWSWAVRLTALSFFGLILRAILLTQSRGGFVALAVSLVLATLVRFRARSVIVPLTVAAVLVVAVAPGRMAEMDDRDGSKSAYYRAELWSAALSMARENPVLGVGKMRFREYSGEMTGKSMIAHNSFAENLAETGIVGLWIFLALIYTSLKGLWRIRGTLMDPKEKSLARAFVVSVVAYAVSSLFLTTDFELFYVQLGLVAAFCATHGQYPKLSLRDLCVITAAEGAFVVGLYGFLQVYI